MAFVAIYLISMSASFLLTDTESFPVFLQNNNEIKNSNVRHSVTLTVGNPQARAGQIVNAIQDVNLGNRLRQKEGKQFRQEKTAIQSQKILQTKKSAAVFLLHNKNKTENSNVRHNETKMVGNPQAKASQIENAIPDTMHGMAGIQFRQKNTAVRSQKILLILPNKRNMGQESQQDKRIENAIQDAKQRIGNRLRLKKVMAGKPFRQKNNVVRSRKRLFILPIKRNMGQESQQDKRIENAIQDVKQSIGNRLRLKKGMAGKQFRQTNAALQNSSDDKKIVLMLSSEDQVLEQETRNTTEQELTKNQLDQIEQGNKHANENRTVIQYVTVHHTNIVHKHRSHDEDTWIYFTVFQMMFVVFTLLAILCLCF